MYSPTKTWDTTIESPTNSIISARFEDFDYFSQMLNKFQGLCTIYTIFHHIAELNFLVSRKQRQIYDSELISPKQFVKLISCNFFNRPGVAGAVL